MAGRGTSRPSGSVNAAMISPVCRSSHSTGEQPQEADADVEVYGELRALSVDQARQLNAAILVSHVNDTGQVARALIPIPPDRGDTG